MKRILTKMSYSPSSLPSEVPFKRGSLDSTLQRQKMRRPSGLKFTTRMTKTSRASDIAQAMERQTSSAGGGTKRFVPIVQLPVAEIHWHDSKPYPFFDLQPQRRGRVEHNGYCTFLSSSTNNRCGRVAFSSILGHKNRPGGWRSRPKAGLLSIVN